MLAEDGSYLEGIFGFSHESYSYDEDQEVSEFLMLQAGCLAELLKPE